MLLRPVERAVGRPLQLLGVVGMGGNEAMPTLIVTGPPGEALIPDRSSWIPNGVTQHGTRPPSQRSMPASGAVSLECEQELTNRTGFAPVVNPTPGGRAMRLESAALPLTDLSKC